MLNFLNWLTPAGLKHAILLGGARWVGTLIGGAVAAWAFSHSDVMAWVNQACAAMSSPAAMTTGISGAAVALACLFFSIKDKTGVDTKMKVVGATAFDQGASAQSDSNQAKVAGVAIAMKAADTAAPATKAAIVIALKNGTF